ncbi:transposase [Hazenella sp. IB182353]|uniref:transposase n=1 Tax=Polycladospora coralii TaxID=2771432 RepID=UPI0017466726|nr:transposase [Polycladospora coralii]
MSKLTSEEKIRAVKLYSNGKESKCETSRIIGVDRSLLRTWIKPYEYKEKSF